MKTASTKDTYTRQAINAVLSWTDAALRDARAHRTVREDAPRILEEANRAISAWEEWERRGEK